MHSSNRRPDCQVGPEGRACLAPALFRAVPAFLAARAVLLRRWPCHAAHDERIYAGYVPCRWLGHRVLSVGHVMAVQGRTPALGLARKGRWSYYFPCSKREV